MSDAKKCDRCGKLYEITSRTIKRTYIIKHDYAFGMNDLDLCSDCYDDLINWINGGIEENNE